MIAVDTNILVYAHREDSLWHTEANENITNLAESGQTWSIPWPCIHEFLAIATHPKIYQPPTPLEKALEQIECWLEAPALTIICETEIYWPELRRTAKITGPQVHDARIATLCLLHGVKELWTADRDFNRYKTLKARNPSATIGNRALLTRPLQATSTRGICRSCNAVAAYPNASVMSSRSMSGKALRISSSVILLATIATIVATGIRRPRMQGTPPICLGFTLIRAISPSSPPNNRCIHYSI